MDPVQSPSSPPSSDKESRDDVRVSLNQRRTFIVRNLRARGMVSLSLLSRHCGSISNSSLQGDIDFLRKLGFSIEAVESGGRRYLVDSQARHLGAKIERTGLHADGKYSIAATACAMLLGLPSASSDEAPAQGTHYRRLRMEISNPEMKELPTAKDLYEAIVNHHKYTSASHAAVTLWHKLDRLWDESVISVFSDSGSTNEKFGQVLRDLFLPTSFSPLRNLHVCTNSRTLFHMLADPEVSTKAIITGGLQLGVDGATDTLAGSLTTSWVSATEGILSFSICFIGATAVDLSEGFFLSDSFEEKTLKEMIMSQRRSKIRAIVIDRSKLDMTTMREGFRFSSISPEQIDVIITDALPEGVPNDGKEPLIQRIRQVFGVPVIEAQSTFPDKEKSLPAILRGRELRTRVSHEDLDNLLLTLDTPTENPSFDPNATPEPRIPTKFVSHFMELFLNAAIQEFFQGSEEIRQKIKARFDALAAESFFGRRDDDQWKLLQLIITEEKNPREKLLSRAVDIISTLVEGNTVDLDKLQNSVELLEQSISETLP